jgi:hypothetical protein
MRAICRHGSYFSTPLAGAWKGSILEYFLEIYPSPRSITNSLCGLCYWYDFISWNTSDRSSFFNRLVCDSVTRTLIVNRYAAVYTDTTIPPYYKKIFEWRHGWNSYRAESLQIGNSISRIVFDWWANDLSHADSVIHRPIVPHLQTVDVVILAGPNQTVVWLRKGFIPPGRVLSRVAYIIITYVMTVSKIANIYVNQGTAEVSLL